MRCDKMQSRQTASHAADEVLCKCYSFNVDIQLKTIIIDTNVKDDCFETEIICKTSSVIYNTLERWCCGCNILSYYSHKLKYILQNNQTLQRYWYLHKLTGRARKYYSEMQPRIPCELCKLQFKQENLITFNLLAVQQTNLAFIKQLHFE